MENKYSRLEYLFSLDNLEKLKKAKVCVVGLGGVGGEATICLARNAIGTLYVMDHDVISPSNYNRQVLCTVDNFGKNKALAMKELIEKINPDCSVYSLNSKFDINSDLFSLDFDYLIDCIDDVDNKYLLIKECINHKITFISSMGTAKKIDLKKLVVTEINKTTYDPLAKIIRKRLRMDNITDKVYVVSSTEEIAKGPKLGSYMPVTATAGLMLADYIIKSILEK